MHDYVDRYATMLCLCKEKTVITRDYVTTNVSVMLLIENA